MKIALMGQDIPALLPSLLADLFFAGRADAEAALQEKNDAMRDLMARYGAAVTRKAGRGRVSVTPDRDAALAGADAVIYAGDPMAASRFRMDREALSGLTEDDPGLSDQARVLGGIGGLMHTLRQAEQILDLCEAMRRDCPDALVITLGSPVARTAALFARQGFRCFGLTQGWRTGPGGLAWLCRELGVKPEDTEAQAAGPPDFTFLTALRDRKTGLSLLPELNERCAEGKCGRLARRWLDLLEAVPVGSIPDHASLMAAQADYMPDPDPLLAEPVEQRKQRILRMNTAADKGLSDPEGQAAQLLLLSGAPAARPVQLALAVLEKRDLRLDAAVRLNGKKAVANLPAAAVIEAPLTLREGVEQPEEIRLPGPLADLCLDIDAANRLAAAAGTGDREALREYIESDPALDGVDRLYALDVVDRLIRLHGDILTRWDTAEDDA